MAQTTTRPEIDTRHPYERRVAELEAALATAEADYARACEANQAVRRQYEERGEPLRKPYRSGFGGQTYLQRDVSDARAAQINAKKRLGAVRDKLTRARLERDRARASAEAQEEAARSIGTYFISTPRSDAHDIERGLSRTVEQDIVRYGNVPQQLSDLGHFYEDLGIVLSEDESVALWTIEENARAIVRNLRAMEKALLALPRYPPEAN